VVKKKSKAKLLILPVVSLVQIQEFWPAPCKDPLAFAPADWEGTALAVLRAENVSAEDKLWTVCHPNFLDERTLRLFAAKCARAALALPSSQPVDPRSMAACAVAERFANGEASAAELAAVWDAARAAARDAAWAAARDAAWDAARAAAWAAAWAAARAAARDAAWAAARDAAWDAARAAAWAAARDAAWAAAFAAAFAAARDAARDAAWAAARDAARDAARAAARAAQLKMLVELIKENYQVPE
jgi:hypothetical protein